MGYRALGMSHYPHSAPAKRRATTNSTPHCTCTQVSGGYFTMGTFGTLTIQNTGATNISISSIFELIEL
ncbi:hypothetical protein [Anabaena sp. CCY 9402-a]|uniref:hypothetical protein n=1 Tax=Anabaena sp. CCY 9402-a TaxID=3103867 RepID=UPI0039C6FA26